jgi:quercetin dioxygenase-like cupin family protein
MTATVQTGQMSTAKTVVEGWGTLTWLASEALTGSQVTVGRVTIRPGMANPRHCHDNCEEVLYLLQGCLRHSVGDQSVELQAGDTLSVPAGGDAQCPQHRGVRRGHDRHLLVRSAHVPRGGVASAFGTRLL